MQPRNLGILFKDQFGCTSGINPIKFKNANQPQCHKKEF